MKSFDVIETHHCLNCGKDFERYVGDNAMAFACKFCGSVYLIKEGKWTLMMVAQSVSVKKLDIPLGSFGKLRGTQYKVVGYCYKKEKGTKNYWHEYTLYNPLYGVAYLAMYNGHWTLLSEMDAPPSVINRRVYIEEKEFISYTQYKEVLEFATGEFFYNIISQERPEVKEFINPPQMCSCEVSSHNISWFLGEYIEPKEIESAFNIRDLPEKVGVGAAQPFAGKFRPEGFIKILAILGALLILATILFYQFSKEEEVFNKTFYVNDSISKREIYTNSFDLKYGTKNVEIKISTDIDNNWMYANVSLVNEKNGDTYNVDLTAEYYSGYDNDGYWSEGASWISKVVSQVPEGRYYLIIYPEKPYNPSSISMNVTVTRDVFVMSNGVVVLGLLGLFPFIYFYRRKNFEERRFE